MQMVHDVVIKTNIYISINHVTEQHVIYYFASDMLHLFYSL